MKAARSEQTRRPTTSYEEHDEKEFKFQPDKLKRVPTAKRHAALPEAFEPRNIKVRVNIYLDFDIVTYFKEQAEKPNAAKYQTQINNALRAYIENNETDEIVGLINNEQFIAAVAERVRERHNKQP
jgi:uncharacterized protein (DUF4415 family)